MTQDGDYGGLASRYNNKIKERWAETTFTKWQEIGPGQHQEFDKE